MNLNADGIPKDNRTLAIALAACAAVALIASSVTKSWLANPHIGDMKFGLIGATSCDLFGECKPRSNGEFITWFRDSLGYEAEKYTSSAFAPVGYVTFVAALLAALGLLVAVALAVTRKRPELPIAPTTVAMLGLFIALIGGCVFVATKPGPPGMIGAAWGFWVFGIAVVVGIAGAQMLAKVLRPKDPDWLTEPSGAPTEPESP